MPNFEEIFSNNAEELPSDKVLLELISPQNLKAAKVAIGKDIEKNTNINEQMIAKMRRVGKKIMIKNKNALVAKPFDEFLHIIKEELIIENDPNNAPYLDLVVNMKGISIQ